MVIVSIAGKSIVSRRHFPTAKSAFQVEQLLDVERFVKADLRFVEACRKRGITDMTGVCVDSWSGGNFGDPGEEGHMISYAHCWLRLRANENFYAHPIDGLNVAVDVKTGEVLRIDDHGGPPIPMAEINYDPEFLPPPRDPMKPLNVIQPEGASFTMDGNAIAWDKWTLGIGFSPREGIILHDIRYAGRPVVRRAAIAELVVPYGSPERGHYRKNIFDIGEYGFGKFNHSLKLGCDCLGVIHYLDSHYCGLDGGTVTIEKGICIHEEDFGHPVEALGLPRRPYRAAPRSPAGDLLRQHRRQLRIRTILVSRPGRRDPLRGQGDRHRQHHGVRARQAQQIRC